ncbi:MAG: helix-turn-helix transcriptional regulator [Lachnospiraceae bacterium]|nr:helix-turn-helix transcriptional regulator [Lachnospiraceae bacterium]
MELGKQIKKYRTEVKLSQEELANRVYVSRQTISNWENDKSYPDVNSLVLLSEIFQISLDKLIKGDIDIMKEVIKEEEVTKFNRYGAVYTVLLFLTIVSAVPLAVWLGIWALIPWGIIYATAMYFAVKIEKVKKANDIQTYKEIVAFSEGKRLDEIQKQREIGKRPYQKFLLVIGSALIGAAACLLIAFLLNIFSK